MGDDTFSPHKTFISCQTPNKLLRCTELSSTDKLVWSRLAQYAGNRSFCFPKQETLAAELGVSVKSIQRSLVALEEMKLLRVERPDGISKMKRRLGNKYYFLKHEILDNLSCDKLSHESEEDEERGTRQTKGVHKNLSCDKLSLQEENQKIEENQESKKYIKRNFAELFPKHFNSHDDFISTWEEFLQFRKEDIKKPVSAIAAKRLIATLVKESANNVNTAIEMINQSIERGYRGIFPIANNSSARQRVKPGYVAKDHGYGKSSRRFNTDTNEWEN